MADMDVLVTGPYGRVGTAIIDHLHDDPRYDFTYYNRSDRPDDHRYGGYDTIVADVADGDALREAAAGHDALIHLAGYPFVESTWDDVHDPNLVGMKNAMEAARGAEMETFVFASTNHVMGMYEEANAPEIYYPGHGMAIDRTDPVRPDSYYGTTKAFGEALGRQFSECYEYPTSFYALRICSLRMPEYDHPYGDAESMVDDGETERGSETYQETVARMKGMWQSRRDFAHQIECCLEDDSVDYGIYSGVSDNDRRWYSIEHARSEIGYSPQDNGDEWDAPPE
jgi:NAD+ dependent glucose-6-phosphate dehydrogenase